MVLAAPILAHLTSENCCPAERFDVWQPLPRRWRGNNRAVPFLQVAELEERLTDVLALAAHWGALVNPNGRGALGPGFSQELYLLGVRPFRKLQQCWSLCWVPQG